MTICSNSRLHIGGVDRLMAVTGGVVRVYGTGGWGFYATSGGGYASPGWDNGVLANVGGGRYTYTMPDAEVWNFNSSGHLTSKVSADGPEGLVPVAGPLINWRTQYHYHSHLPPVWVDDDRGLLTCASFSEVGWWNPETGKEVRRLRPNLWNVATLIVSPDGQYLAVTGWYGCRLYQVRTGQPVGLTLGHTNHVPCAAFSADSRWLLTGSTDQSIKLWSVPGGEPQGMPVPLSSEVYATAFLGNRLVAGQMDGVVRLWGPGQATMPFQDYAAPAEKKADLNPLADPAGRYLLEPASATSARVIDLETGKQAGKTLEHIGLLLHGAFVPGGSRVVAQTRRTVGVWDWQTGAAIWGPEDLPAVGYAAGVSPDGRWLVSLCADPGLQPRHLGLLMDAATGKTVAKFVHEGKPELVNYYPNVRFSPDGSCFITFNSWPTVAVWNTDSAKLRYPPLRHEDYVTSAAFSADSRYLATGGNDHSARVFELATGKELARLAQPHWVFDVAFSSDDRLLLTTSRDGTARLWDWQAGKLVCPPMDQGQELTNGRFLPGTPWLALMTWGTLQAWDAVLGKPLTPPLPKETGWGLRLVLEGRKAAAFGEKGHVRVFDLSPLADDNPQRLSSEQVRLRGELQSMHAVHEGGGVVRLTTGEWLERWRRFRSERPDLPPWSDTVALDQWLDRDQPETLHSLHGRAVQYRDARRFAEAVPIFQQALDGYRRRLGPLTLIPLPACATSASCTGQAASTPRPNRYGKRHSRANASSWGLITPRRFAP